jgi:hypothetical protein
MDERRTAARRRELVPLGGQRSGDSRKRGGTHLRRTAARRRSPPPRWRGEALPTQWASLGEATQ